MPHYTNEQLQAIFGPAASHAEYAPGDAISFRDPVTGQELSGDVLYPAAPIQSQSGSVHPLQYFVDCGDGFPHVVQSGDIRERRG